jgi:hypothetical protein
VLSKSVTEIELISAIEFVSSIISCISELLILETLLLFIISSELVRDINGRPVRFILYRLDDPILSTESLSTKRAPSKLIMIRDVKLAYDVDDN